MAAGQKHPALDELSAFSQGRLSAPEQATIERHVAGCDTCCDVLRRLPEDTLVERMRRANHSPSPDTATPPVPPSNSPLDKRLDTTHGPPPELLDHPRYRVIKLLGVGGMGVVYKAEHRLMERPVALKVMNRSILSRPIAIERFRLEVKAAARLSHPNIVAAHDAEQAGNLHFLVMEYVEGASLDRVVAKNGPLSVLHAANFIRQAAQGLQHAFENGMVHRDVKPQNLMLTTKRQVKILDFGLARLAREPDTSASVDGDPIANAATQLTATGALLGTPDYIAPEQIFDPSQSDTRSDIYSLGCTLYYLLAGRVPFADGSVFEKLNAHAERDPHSLQELRPDLPQTLVRVVQRMMAKQPARRFQTPADVAKALEPFAKPATQSRDTAAAAVPADLAAPLLRELLGDETHPDTDPDAPTDPFTDTGTTVQRSNWATARRARTWRARFLQRPTVAACGFALLGGALLLPFMLGERPATTPPMPPDSGAEAPDGDRSPPGRPASEPRRPTDRSTSIPPPAAARTRPHRVLLILAANNFYYPDYEPVRRVLEEAGAQVTVAASHSPARPAPAGGGEEVTPDILLTEVRSAEFDAVVFCGGHGIWEFLDEKWSAPFARTLIQEMLAADKHVAALCMGPAVLAKAGVLDGVRATGHSLIREKVGEFGAELVSDPVVVSGKLITGRDDKVAEDFARTLLQELDRAAR